MADTTVDIKILDLPSVQHLLEDMKQAVAQRTKCGIADCPQEGLTRNCVEAVVGKYPVKHLRLYLCDTHYEEWL
jgi:hypothetical protein